MMKKWIAVLLAVAMLFAFAACGETTPAGDEGTSANVENLTSGANSDVKVGFIFLHDENSTYDKNFIDAARAAQAALNLSDEQVLFKTNIPEGQECYEAGRHSAGIRRFSSAMRPAPELIRKASPIIIMLLLRFMKADILPVSLPV